MKEGLSYDDVLLIPKLGILETRSDASIHSVVTRGFPVDIPIISANMESVTGLKLADKMHQVGAAAAFPRFKSTKQAITLMDSVRYRALWSVSLDDWYALVTLLVKYDHDTVLLDVAHAHSTKVLQTVKDVVGYFPTVKLVVGNVATLSAASALMELGVDGIKVGVGPGAACTTRLVTGFGVPQFTALQEVCKVRDTVNPGVTVIADGGIKNSGDIVKALAAGANTVMIGSLLAGTNESPKPGRYWGSASYKANGHRAPEGEVGRVPRTGSVEDTVKKLAWGIRSGVSYGGAQNLNGLRKHAEFIRVSPLSAVETGVRLS